MKAKAILIVLLINTIILPAFMPAISFAYEDLEKEEVLTENEVEQEETKEDESLKESEDTKEEDIEETTEQEPEILSEQDEKITDIEVTEEQDVVQEEDVEVEKVMKAVPNVSDQLPEGDGEYTISTALDNKKVLDVDGGSKNNGANIQLYEGNKSDAQKFNLKYNASTKTYTIIAINSNKVLDVYCGASNNGTNVQQYDGNNTKAQQWVLKNAGNGYYYIISKCNGLYLDVNNGEAKNGSNIQVYEGNGSNAQKFKFIKNTDMETEQLPEGDGTYIISTALNRDKVLDVSGGSISNGANIQLWEEANAKQQKFKLTYNASTKTYTITATHSNKVLDVYCGASSNGTNVQQYDGNNTKAQQWVLKNAGNGYFYIISKCNGLYLDVNNAIAKNGSNIQVYEGNGSNAQKFKFIKNADIETEQLPKGDGIYIISTALKEDKVLDVDGGITNNGANIQLWDWANVKQQKFKLTYNASTKTYTITATHSNKVLDVYSGASNNGTNVQQYDGNNTKAQQWVLKNAGNGYFYIISKCNGLYLDVNEAIAENGSNIQVYEGNGSNAQKFKFTKNTDIETHKLPEGDGTYIISTALNKDKVLDVSGGSTSNGANIQLWEEANVKQQKFKLTYNASTKTYTITATHSNKVLDVYCGASSNGTNVQQYDGNNTTAQQWILQDAGNGYFYIISKCNGLYLDVAGGNASNGSNIQVYEGNGSNAQKFKFTTIGVEDGLYTIKTAINNQYVLDVQGGSGANGANVQLYTANGTAAQKWEVKYIGKGYYSIIASHSGKALDVYCGASDNGTNVQQYDSNNTIAQQWILKEAGNGYYYIVSRCNNLYLDVSYAIAKDGANIQVYEKNGSNAQKFKFEKTSKTNSSNFQNLNEKQYPGYKAMLQQLQNKHPNWSFEIYYTGLNWNVAVNQQDVLASINSPRSLVHEYYYLHDKGGAEWIQGTDKYDTSKEWYRASKKGIGYMMDPRNSLEEAWIFQFQDLTDASATKEEIIKMLANVTFLKNKETAADTIVKQCAKKGVNPFHIVARMVQEQGNNGGSSNGFKCTHAHKNTVYNLFNIKVSGSNGLVIGANYACDMGWFTQEKCIEDSIDFIKKEYIGVGQSTLYFQKYNVVNQIYSHQYMTNIYGANDEGNKMYQGYHANGLLNREFKFVIPVYENMPSAPSPRPGK